MMVFVREEHEDDRVKFHEPLHVLPDDSLKLYWEVEDDG